MFERKRIGHSVRVDELGPTKHFSLLSVTGGPLKNCFYSRAEEREKKSGTRDPKTEKLFISYSPFGCNSIVVCRCSRNKKKIRSV